MKGYVLVRKGYEYDDNIYYEVNGSTPQLILFNKEDVLEKIKDANIKEFKEVSIHNYFYDISDVLLVELSEYNNFNESLIKKYGPIDKKNRWDDDKYILHPLANEEESYKYMSMLNISFYDFVETDIDMESYREHKLSQVFK